MSRANSLISAFTCMSTVEMTKAGCVFSIKNISCFFENCSNTCHKTYLKACACCVRSVCGLCVRQFQLSSRSVFCLRMTLLVGPFNNKVFVLAKVG